ncbi:MAG: 4-alpha-glucanotransferase [Dongiaceae bacterium]
MSDGSHLDALCRAMGIQWRYTDQAGNPHEASSATLHAMLAALGYPVRDETEAAQALRTIERRSVEAMIAPTILLRRGEDALLVPLTLRKRDETRLSWWLITENDAAHGGETHFGALPLLETVWIDGEPWERRSLALPEDLPLGYHTLEVTLPETPIRTVKTHLILAPARAYLPRSLEQGGRRLWGIALQLYALRSDRNWGIGDFTDLRYLVRAAAAAGADFVGLNPLHALYADAPEQASPYSPSSRRFLNSLYIDPAEVPEFAACGAEAAAPLKQTIARLRSATLIDYRQVGRCKHAVLERLYEHFCAAGPTKEGQVRATALRKFQRQQGPALRVFATFEALREALGKADPAFRDWRNWPAELRNPQSGAVSDFVATHRERVEYFEYLQWQAALQLEAAAAAARDAGMAIGLYIDLAVGVDAGGADGWELQETLVPGWSIGAPPDEWNLKGQEWGLPPFNPFALAMAGYRPFIETLRASMRQAGALRIDHVLGLKRLFWVRAGAGPADGLYLHYPFRELAGIVALESHRNRCFVVGEDLGTLPDGLPEALQTTGILSYRLLYFTRAGDGGFEPPQHFPRQAAVALSTHDLPTLAGWWAGSDIELRAALDLYPSPDRLAQDRRERPEARRLLLQALREAGLSGEEEPPVEEAHRFLARTPAMLMVLQAEDMLGVTEQVNVPGTIDEHPNWRRRLPLTVDAMFEAPLARCLAAALAEERAHKSDAEP